MAQNDKAHIIIKLLFNHYVKGDGLNNINANLYYLHPKEKQKALKIDILSNKDLSYQCIGLSATSIQNYNPKYHKIQFIPQYKRKNGILTRINAKDELNKSTNIIFLANPSKKVNIDYLHLNKKFGEGKLGIMYKI